MGHSQHSVSILSLQDIKRILCPNMVNGLKSNIFANKSKFSMWNIRPMIRGLYAVPHSLALDMGQITLGLLAV